MFEKNTIFCRFLSFLDLLSKTLCFLYWPFLLLVLIFCVFVYLLLLFDKSSCYVLVSVFVVLGFLGLVMWYVLFFGGFFLVLFCWGV